MKIPKRNYSIKMLFLQLKMRDQLFLIFKLYKNAGDLLGIWNGSSRESYTSNNQRLESVGEDVDALRFWVNN